MNDGTISVVKIIIIHTSDWRHFIFCFYQAHFIDQLPNTTLLTSSLVYVNLSFNYFSVRILQKKSIHIFHFEPDFACTLF